MSNARAPSVIWCTLARRATARSKDEGRRDGGAEAPLPRAIGLCGGLLGGAVARGGALLVDWLARTRLPAFPFKPESFFAFPVWIGVGAVAAGLAAALLGALVPARTAVRVDPSRIL